jgi:hypothetical protein
MHTDYKKIFGNNKIKLFLIISIIFLMNCCNKYDGEIFITSKGEIVKVKYQGAGELYFIIPVDTVDIKRVNHLLNKKTILTLDEKQ